MLNKKEFYGDEFYNFLLREFEKSRYYLKHCGKPRNWYEEWLITFHKETCSLMKLFLKESK